MPVLFVLLMPNLIQLLFVIVLDELLIVLLTTATFLLPLWWLFSLSELLSSRSRLPL